MVFLTFSNLYFLECTITSGGKFPEKYFFFFRKWPGLAMVCNRYTMPTKDLSRIQKAIIIKLEGVA